MACLFFRSKFYGESLGHLLFEGFTVEITGMRMWENWKIQLRQLRVGSDTKCEIHTYLHFIENSEGPIHY